MPALPSPARFALDTDPDLPVIRQTALASEPFSVAGAHGAILGQQNGESELWLYPWKIVSHLRITARMDDYGVPIEVNPFAERIEVRPEATIITYAHANFTIRQVMLTPQKSSAGAGVEMFFSIESVRPMTLAFTMTPEMQRMWPVANEGPAQPEWIAAQPGSGFYILHLNTQPYVAAVAMPAAEAAPKVPYQERDHRAPLQFLLRFDPARDGEKIFPLLVALGQNKAESEPAYLAERLERLNASTAADYAANRTYYKNLLADSVTVRTPDARLNDAFKWAVVSMDQLRVETGSYPGEQAYTAGVLESGESLRPGYGWYFGRDALWTAYAFNSLGNFAHVREQLEFLLRRQSGEGKILHEWSQTADLVDWRSLPYAYAEADATLLLPMAVNDYLRVSGDRAFVAAHWEQLARAWHYQTTHDADGDGIYDNAQGTGWVESWPGGMPKQEIYLAVLDEQASTAFAALAQATGHEQLAQQARLRAKNVAATIEKEYFVSGHDVYAFSWNAGEGADTQQTIFPSVAWWDGDYALAQPGPMFARWASKDFSTDWGARLISDDEKNYDPISYHQGSVWPLFTGWVSLAEYRTGRDLPGYAHLMQNANLTWSQDLGSITEVLSGAYMKPLQCSSAHQLWSSAMVVTPALRGLFGLEWNEPEHTLNVTPHLPATWNEATVQHIPWGSNHFDLRMRRTARGLVIESLGAPAGLELRSKTEGARIDGHSLIVPLPPVEVGMDVPPAQLGDSTSQLKVLDEKSSPRGYELTLEGVAGASYSLHLRENQPRLSLHAEGAQLGDLHDGVREMSVHFEGNAGYQYKKVVLSW